jgi:hypothetical protein
MEETLIMGFVGLGGALADKEAIILAVGSVVREQRAGDRRRRTSNLRVWDLESFVSELIIPTGNLDSGVSPN